MNLAVGNDGYAGNGHENLCRIQHVPNTCWSNEDLLLPAIAKRCSRDAHINTMATNWRPEQHNNISSSK